MRKRVFAASLAWLAPLMAFGGVIHLMTEMGDLAGVRRELVMKPASVNMKDEEGRTALHMAAASNRVNIVEALLAAGAEVDARDAKGWTPLHYAAANDGESSMRILTGKGADPIATANDGRTPLMVAMKNNAKQAARVMALTVGTVMSDKMMDPRVDAKTRQTLEVVLGRALGVLSGLIRDYPENEAINFAYGMTQFALGDVSRAQLAFERVLDINPRNDRARLELGRTMVARQQYGLAEEQFRMVLKNNPPESVKKNVEAYLDKIEETRKAWVFMNRFDAGVIFDSNVNAGPKADVVSINPIFYGPVVIDTLKVGDTSKPAEDDGTAVSFYLSGERDIGRPGGWAMNLAGYYYQSWMNKREDFSSMTMRGETALKYTEGRSSYRLPAGWMTVELGGDDLMNVWSFAPGATVYLDPASDWMCMTDLTIGLYDYAALNDRDATKCSASSSLRRNLPAIQSALTFGAALHQNGADKDIYSCTASELLLQGDVALPYDSALYARVRHSNTAYEKRETLAPEVREDQTLVYTVGIRKALWRRFGIDCSYEATDNSSTVDLYEYERAVTTLTVSGSY